MERRAIPGGHADRRIGGVLGRIIPAPGDRVGPSDQILPSAMRHGLAIGDNLPAGMAVFGLREMLVAVGIGHVGGWRRSATGESPRRHAKAHGAPPSSIARIHVRFKARNAHHAYSGRAPAQGSSFKRRARHSNRVFPNHQARCALLIPLRFEFDNEFHSRNPNEEPLSRPHEGTDSLDSRPAVRRISAARSDAQTRQQRGQPIAQDTGHLSCEDLDVRITPPSASAFQHAGPNAVQGPTAFEERVDRLRRIETVKGQQTPPRSGDL